MGNMEEKHLITDEKESLLVHSALEVGDESICSDTPENDQNMEEKHHVTDEKESLLFHSALEVGDESICSETPENDQNMGERHLVTDDKELKRFHSVLESCGKSICSETYLTENETSKETHHTAVDKELEVNQDDELEVFISSKYSTDQTDDIPELESSDESSVQALTLKINKRRCFVAPIS